MANEIITKQDGELSKYNKVIATTLKNAIGRIIDVDQKAIEHRSTQVNVLKDAIRNLKKLHADQDLISAAKHVADEKQYEQDIVLWKNIFYTDARKWVPSRYDGKMSDSLKAAIHAIRLGADVNYVIDGSPWSPIYAAIYRANDIAFELLRVNGARLELPSTYLMFEKSMVGSIGHNSNYPKTLLEFVEERVRNNRKDIMRYPSQTHELDEELKRLERIRNVIIRETKKLVRS